MPCLKIAQSFTPFSAFHQFFHTLPIIWGSSGGKIQDGVPLKLKYNVLPPNSETKAII
jgi:hypothetical protein